MKPIWNGSLSFGLVNIPIRVYVASEEHVLEFDMLHAKDLSPIRYARICKKDGKEVPFNQIVKGYKYEKGKYVVVEEEDFKKANAKKTSTIEIESFTELDEIDPIYFERPYYLEPDKKASKAYALLREALTRLKKVAVCTFVFRNREHLGVIRPYGKVLVLYQLRYEIEVRSYDSLSLPAIEKKSNKEADFAIKLIEKLTEDFKPEKFHDTYVEELYQTIKDKVKGKKKGRKTKVVKEKPVHGDLTQLLKESLTRSKRK